MSLPSDPAARKAIKDCLVEISNCYTRIEGQRYLIKEATANICEQFELSKKTFRRLTRTYHKQNFSKEVAEHEEFEIMYEQLTGETHINDL